MKTGIYKLTNIVTGMFYIGSSVNIPVRTRKHILDLQKGTHDNKYLQNSYQKYGGESFDVSIVLLCSKDNLLLYEQLIIDGLSACDRSIGYNLCPVAGSTKNKVVSDESRALMSIAGKAKKLSKEHKERISRSLIGNKRRLGVPHSDERRKEISAFFKGRKFSAETIAKMNAGRELARIKNLQAVT